MPNKTIEKYFREAIDKKASDIYLIADQRPVVRIDGELSDLEDTVLNDTALQKMIQGVVSEERWKIFSEKRDMDFAYSINEHRMRINLHFQQDKIGLAARIIPKEIPTPEELEFTDTIKDLTTLKSGFILVTGPSGVGKSTTLAAMINMMNERDAEHIITLEDPIEFVYPKLKSTIEQREVGIDTKSFYDGLKYALRQDPDVILVGEMRDEETMSAALTAAETGHVVLSTLHTNSAAETVDRIIDMFDSNRRHQILVQLAATLKAVISQELLPRKGGGIVALREIMLSNSAISNLIRSSKIEQIPTVIQTSRKQGMMTKEGALKELLDKDLITEETYDIRMTQGEVGNHKE